MTSAITSPLTRPLTRAMTGSLGDPLGGGLSTLAKLASQGFRVVATRGSMQYTTTATSGVNLTLEGRYRQRICAAGLTSIKAIWSNWYVDGASPSHELNNANDVPIIAALEWDGTTSFTQHTKNGSGNIVIPAGQDLVADDILASGVGLTTFDQYGLFHERSSSVLPLGQTWLQGHKAARVPAANTTDEFQARHNPAALQALGTGAMSITGGGQQRPHLPTCYVGQASNPGTYRALYGLGDSRLQDVNDAADTTEGATGFFERACMWDGARAIASLNCARSSDSAVRAVADGCAKRLDFARFCTDAVIWYGANDIELQSRTAAQIIADLKTLAGWLRARGIKKIVVVNDTPHTSGTAGAQTVKTAFEAIRAALNPLIVAAVGTDFDYLLDASGLLADSVDPTKWNPTYFQEGLHPNSAGHAVLKTALLTIMTAIGY